MCRLEHVPATLQLGMCTLVQLCRLILKKAERILFLACSPSLSNSNTRVVGWPGNYAQDREVSTAHIYSNAAFTQTTPKPPPPVPGPSRHEVSALQVHTSEMAEQNA
jgi:hypothetical protein